MSNVFAAECCCLHFAVTSGHQCRHRLMKLSQFISFWQVFSRFDLHFWKLSYIPHGSHGSHGSHSGLGWFFDWSFFSLRIFIRFQTDVQELKLYSVSVTVTNWKAYLAPGDTAWWNFIDLCDTMSKVMQISDMCNTIGHLPSGVNYTIKMSAKCCDSRICMIVPPSPGKNFLPLKFSLQRRSNNKMVTMAAFVHHLNWKKTKHNKKNSPNGGYNIENFFIFCLLLL